MAFTEQDIHTVRNPIAFRSAILRALRGLSSVVKPTPDSTDNERSKNDDHYWAEVLSLLNAAADPSLSIVTDATTARTLSFADGGKYLRMTNAGAITITLPANSALALPIGFTMIIRRATGAGVITLAGTPTVNDDDSENVEAGKTFGLKKIAADVWDFI